MRTDWILATYNGVRLLNWQAATSSSPQYFLRMETQISKSTYTIFVKKLESSQLTMFLYRILFLFSKILHKIDLGEMTLNEIFSPWPSGNYRVNISGSNKSDKDVFHFTYIADVIRKWSMLNTILGMS